MIDGEFVIDGVVHAYNQTEANFADEVGGRSMTEMAYLLAKGSNDPLYELSREVYLSDWSVDDLANLMFRESQTDVAVFHHLALGSFKDGYASLEKAAEALEKYPNRFIGAYANVDPLEERKAVESLERQYELLKPFGLKLYPTSWKGDKPVSWRMDDPKLIYPLFEKASELGLRHVAVHKAVPIGPFPVGDAYDPSDLENAATDFPELSFEIVHGGLARSSRRPAHDAMRRIAFPSSSSDPISAVGSWPPPFRVAMAVSAPTSTRSRWPAVSSPRVTRRSRWPSTCTRRWSASCDRPPRSTSRPGSA
jgi:predicted TIM-barrel fold metal-dependent hydrolase